MKELEAAVAEEPARTGEGGVDCWQCTGQDDEFLWTDERWRLSLYTPSPYRGVVLLQPRVRDGAAHFHLWFYPRPYGQLQLRGTFLPMWGLVLPDLPDDEVRAAGEQIARALG